MAESVGHLSMGNYGTHNTALIRRWLLKRPRFHVHFAPTNASWFNLLERWRPCCPEKQLRRGVLRSTQALRTTSAHTSATPMNHPKPFA